MCQLADAALITTLITWLYQASPATCCCTRLAWAFIGGLAPRLWRTPYKRRPGLYTFVHFWGVCPRLMEHGRGRRLGRRARADGRLSTCRGAQHARAPRRGASVGPQPGLPPVG